MSKIKVMIADDIEETRSVIKKILQMEEDKFEIAGEAVNGQESYDLIPKYMPDVILMDINMPVMNGLEATEKITEAYPSIIVIIMSVQGENEYLKRAMFSGAKEYIIKPFNYNDLTKTIEATYNKHKHKNIEPKPKEEGTKNAKIITMYSSKGGVGKSVLSINSGIILSNNLNKKTLLIDMDLQYGDISLMLNKFTEKNMLDMIDDNQVDSYESMKPYLSKFNDNLDILLAPRNPDSAEYIGKDAVEKIIYKLKEFYDVIVIDTGVNYNDLTLYILDISEFILFVTNMEIVSLKNTKLGLSVMKAINYDSNKVKLIVNGATNKYGVKEKDLEEVFKEKIYCIIPEDIKNIRESINKGVPICSTRKGQLTKFSKALKGLCNNLTA